MFTAQRFTTRPPACIITRLAITLTTLAILPFGAQAQAAGVQEATEGSTVRITAPSLGLKKKKGTVIERTPDHMVVKFRRAIGTLEIPYEDVDALAVSIDQRRPVAKGAAIGLLTGGAFGALLGLADGNDTCKNCLFNLSAQEKATLGGISFAVVGGVIGLIAGAIATQDEWVPGTVSFDPPPITPVVTDNGAGLSVNIRF
jgi:hypothetical protein